MKTFFLFQNSHGQTSNKRCLFIITLHPFQYREPRRKCDFRDFQNLNDLNTMYVRNSVQMANMATPAYEQTLPRLTTDYPALDAAYDEKHANSSHGDIPYYRHSKLPLKVTQRSLDDSLYMVMCTQSYQARKRYTIGAALFS